ncbi:MAG: nodulation protein NfeD [Pseudomonadales bacterium]
MGLRRVASIGMKPQLYALWFGLLVLFAHAETGDETGRDTPAAGAVWVVKIDGAIGPATTDYVVRSFEKAQANGASLIVIEMNTPGGLDNAMRDIIQAILASPVPVVSYVSPQGSRAASAGTYILYASHFAAMAEATTLGAATPVQLGGPSSPAPPDSPKPQPAPEASDEDGKQDSDSPTGDKGGTAMERKMVNDAAAYIRGLAELRGRNAEWAEKAVREAASLSASEALEKNVINLIAKDLKDLLAQLDGSSVEINDENIELQLADKTIHVEAPDWRTELLTTLTNPNLVLILGMIGIYGIILEFYNPGAMIPGTVGIICLLLAGYSLQLLPVNYAGLGLIIVGIILMIGEAMVPSFGVMGIGGVIAFTMGGILLFDTDIEAFRISIPVIAAVGVVTAALIIATVNLALKIRHKHVTTGVDTLIGQTGTALTDIGDTGQVRLGGEIWYARSDQQITEGERVRVVSVDALTVSVEKLPG